MFHTLFLFLLFVVSFPLMASSSNWSLWDKPKATQFECIYNCGKWGSASIREVEWHFVLALWDYQRIIELSAGSQPYPYLPNNSIVENVDVSCSDGGMSSRTCYSFPFYTGNPYFINLPPPPKQMDPVWYKKLRTCPFWPSKNISRDHVNVGIDFPFPFLYSATDWVIIDHEDQSSRQLLGRGFKKSWYIADNPNDRGGDSVSKKSLRGGYSDSMDPRMYCYYLCWEWDWSDGFELSNYKDLLDACYALKETVNKYVSCFAISNEGTLRVLEETLESLDVLCNELTESISQNSSEIQKLIQKRAGAKALQEQRDHLKKQEERLNRFSKDSLIVRAQVGYFQNQIAGWNGGLSISPMRLSLEKHLEDCQETFKNIHHRCAEKHEAPSAFYHKALFSFESGMAMECLSDLKCLFERIDMDLLDKTLHSSIFLKKGQSESEVGLYNEAILSLGRAIENSSSSNLSEIYLERAIAYFETGNLEEAIQDFKRSNIQNKDLNIENGYLFSLGLVEGTLQGGMEGLVNFFPSLLDTASGLGHGIWAFAESPIECTKEFYQGVKDCVAFLKEHPPAQALGAIIPELGDLMHNWDHLNLRQQGEKIGLVIGKYGIDIFLTRGAVKGVKAYRDLRKANATLTLRHMASSPEFAIKVEQASKNWWRQTSKQIEQLKKGKDLDANLYKAFRKQVLTEVQVRKILHKAGYKTFPRPKGIPQDWTVRISQKGGGIVYQHKNNQFYVRVSPGNPTSPNYVQQHPYVVHVTDKGCLNKDGKLVRSRDVEAHIPLDQYDFEKLSKMVPPHD
ncbi:MAG: hypothetical protein HYZ47_03865 [Simkania negevensis]|nr:hypothetical protein [Simkania negevensis]